VGETPAPVAPQAAPRKASSVRILLMLVFGGPVLAVGGCALFAAYLNINGGSSSNDTISAVGAIIFVVGVLSFLVGIIWALARWADSRVKAGKK
jgi:protein-S-isoprenylcysteine O-methyltransferase Ste14